LYLYISLGLLYLLVCPILSEPDAKNHYCRAYEVSEGAFLSRTNAQGDAEGAFALPQGWVNANGATQVSLYESWFQRDYQIEDEGKELYQFNNMALYSPVSYLPQATAFAVARLFTHNFLATVMFARLLTFVMAGALFYLAIHLSPIGKHYLLWVALLPMGMELAVSISPDMITTALVCLLVSMVCRYRYGTAKVSKAELILLYAVAILLGQYKIVYVGCCLLLFLIPANAFGGKKAYFIHAFVLGGLVLITSLGWLHISSSFLSHQYSLSNAQKDFIRYNPKAFVLVLVSTFLVYCTELIQTMIGSKMGALELETSPFLVLIIMGCFISWLTRDRQLRKERKADCLGAVSFVLVSILTIVLIFSSIYIQWNAPGEKLVGGLQGRYFIPILFPLLLVLGRRTIREPSDLPALLKDEQRSVERSIPLLISFHLCFLMQLFLYFVY
ncbi:MAG: DUF2142 domain-containing protein, partial [Lachnospiraceae bacterium]|nr:DUF2142 domain-containing protein [Lachnospiraceae bacterium]